jgi:hypothetical protein
VAVLEGEFAALRNLGLPLSVSLQLQEMGLKLSTALWTVRSTSSGFSVSLFWPNDTGVTVGRHKRRRAKAKSLGTKAANQYLEPTVQPYPGISLLHLNSLLLKGSHLLKISLLVLTSLQLKVSHLLQQISLEWHVMVLT